MAVKCLLTFPFFLFFLQSFCQQPHTETTVNIRNQRVKNRIHKYKSRHSVFKHGLRLLFVSHNLSVYLRSKDSFLKHTSVKRSWGQSSTCSGWGKEWMRGYCISIYVAFRGQSSKMKGRSSSKGYEARWPPKCWAGPPGWGQADQQKQRALVVQSDYGDKQQLTSTFHEWHFGE